MLLGQIFHFGLNKLLWSENGQCDTVKHNLKVYETVLTRKSGIRMIELVFFGLARRMHGV